MRSSYARLCSPGRSVPDGLSLVRGSWTKPKPNLSPTRRHTPSSCKIDVAAAPSIAIVHRGVNAKGEPAEWAIHADLEGKLFGVINTPDMDGVRCWLSDPHTILLKLMRDSATAAWETPGGFQERQNAETHLHRGGRQEKRLKPSLISISRNPRACPLPKRP